MTCIREIVFSLACVLPRPDAPEPMYFGYGKAVNRAVIAASFVPQAPDIGPEIAMKPERIITRPNRGNGKRSGAGLAVLAYGQERSSGTQFKAIDKGAFRVAHANVKTSCFPRRLIGIIHDAERHFGGKVIVTSGYRSKVYNRRVRGATRSQHMNCKAADMRIPGVSKTKLHAYLLRHPKRGGVGIYRSKWIHVDVGSRRQWDWR